MRKELDVSAAGSKPENEISETVQRLNRVSPSFCLAKWLQVTLHLHLGINHSCHHPKTHAIDPKGIEKDPSRLHNTPFKMLQRKEMLEGRRPSECDYCWRIEDTDKNSISDRHFKSHDWWARPQLDLIAKSEWNAPVAPTYMEVSFSNTCNFKCAYCQPFASSQWVKEVLTQGSYNLKDMNWPDYQDTKEISAAIKPESENTYIKAFWNWWPELTRSLKIFRITGGEPLLSPNTFKVIDYFQNEARPELEFYINSNLGVAPSVVQKAVSGIRSLTEKKHIKSFMLYTSIDTWGAQAEYIRDGLNLDLYVKNLDFVLQNLKNTRVTFMVTFNVLSLDQFVSFLEFIKGRRKWIREELNNGNEIVVDISYLRHPEFLSAQLATPDLLLKAVEILDYMRANSKDHDPDGFIFFELEKMERLLKWLQVPQDPTEQAKLHANFFAYVTEYDNRRKKNFLQTFPLHQQLYELGKAAYESK